MPTVGVGNRAALGLVVERDVAGDDRRFEGAAGIADPADALRELPHDLRPLGRSEVEAVGDRDRAAAARRDVARRLGHRLLAAFVRIEIAVDRIHVAASSPARGRFLSRERPRRRAAPAAQSCSCARSCRTAPRSSASSRDSARRGAAKSCVGQIAVVELFALRAGRDAVRVLRRRERPVVHRRLGRDRIDRDRRDFVAMPEEAHESVVRRPRRRPRHRGPTSRRCATTSSSRPCFATMSIRSCDSESMISYGVMPLSRTARGRDRMRDTGARAAGHLERRRSQPGGAHVLNADDGIRLHDLQTRLEQQLLRERIADLHRRAFLFGRLVELRRGHRGAVDAVAARLRSDVDHRIADAARRSLEDAVAPCTCRARRR